MSAPMLASVEELRAEGLAARSAVIGASAGHPSRGSLPLYQSSARAAFEAAAACTEQPEDRP